MTKRPSTSYLARAALAAAALGLLAACAEPVAPDYQERYAVTAYPTTVALDVHVTGGRIAFADDEESRFASLVTGYVDRGHGPLTISGAAARLSAVRTRLIAAGVAPRDIREVVSAQGSPGLVTLSYQRYEAVVPSCGNWASSLSFDPSNNTSPNFGCAMQHDIGLMAADPADLVRPRPTAPTDGQTASRVIQKYRAAAPTWVTPNPLQIFGNSENPPGAGQ